MSIMELLVAWPGTISGAWEEGGGEMRRNGSWLCLGGDLAGLCFLALGSEGEGGAGMTQSCWFGQMAGQWCHLLS